MKDRKEKMFANIIIDFLLLFNLWWIVYFDVAVREDILLNCCIAYICMIICAGIFYSIKNDETDYYNRNNYLKKVIMMMFFVCSFTIIAITVSGQKINVIVPYVGNLLIFIFTAVGIMYFGFYILTFCRMTEQKSKIYGYIFMLFTGAQILLILSTPFSHLCFYIDDMGYVVYPNTYMFSDIYAVVVLTAVTVLIIRSDNDNRNKLFQFSYVVVCILGVVIDTIGFFTSGGTVSDALLCLVFVTSLVLIFCNCYIRQHEEVITQKETLTNLQLNAMISQIEPHFIYNTLGTIDSLCEDDPAAARRVIWNFSEYLRANYQNITEKPLISIADEIKNLKTYTEIEMVRFPRVKVEFDLREECFEIPSLTLQPLVENAIKHGICQKKRSEGTVKIISYSNESNYIIEIEDDGIGFESIKPDDGRVHVGINNVRQRLHILCGGSLTVDSTVSVGTKCTICIPKNKE